MSISCKQNWNLSSEIALNKQINLELFASYNYLYMSNHFGKDILGLDKLRDYFYKCSEEERGHAKMLIDYQNKRGGSVSLENINKPNIELKNNNFNDVLDAFKIALELEKQVNESLLSLHKIGDENIDPQFCDYIEGTFLEEQVEAINEITKYINILNNIGDDKHGIWEFVNKL